MELILPILGVAFTLLGLGHEVAWRRRFNGCTLGMGTVVDLAEDSAGDSSYCRPVVEYSASGHVRTFVSSYSEPPTPFIGTRVPIVVSLDGKHAELHAPSKRLGNTAVPFAVGMALNLAWLWLPT